MKSKIFSGYVKHTRLEPVRHSFRYNMYMYSFDLDELEALDEDCFMFGYNRIRPIALHDADYLKGKGSIKQKLLNLLHEHGRNDRIERVELVTAARFFNYVFNPVNFYYCYAKKESLKYVVAEVNNTFGERHLYILDEPVKTRKGFTAQYQTAKAFHVSPFKDMTGEYDFCFADITKTLDIRINMIREGKVDFLSRLAGTPKPLNTRNITLTILKYPLSAVLTIPRIVWQAAKLYYWKGLKVHEKPTPTSPLTIKVAPPKWYQKISMKFVFGYLKDLKQGHLSVRLPDRSELFFGNTDSDLRARMLVNDYDFFWRIARDGDIGFGESYMAGEWDTTDLPGLIRFLIETQNTADNSGFRFVHLFRLLKRVGRRNRGNGLVESKKNIRDHYDLGNDMFSAFLDASMTYSCAKYHSQDESLEQAQINKLHSIIKKAQIKSSDHVLEIGSGWGSFAIEACRQTGCRVTTITLSEEQLQLARDRVKKHGMEDSISVELCDYRKMEGRFDKIVSIEMLEAVGHKYYGSFFESCDRLLKPEGLVVLQVITIPDFRYDNYRKNGDWIQKHIFPGGLLPSLTALSKAVTANSGFVVENIENIGIHYARTLAQWRNRFQAGYHKLKRPEWDEAFRRKWLYYFSYCEAAFASRTLSTLQIVMTRPNNASLDEISTSARSTVDRVKTNVVYTETATDTLISDKSKMLVK